MEEAEQQARLRAMDNEFNEASCLMKSIKKSSSKLGEVFLRYGIDFTAKDFSNERISIHGER